MNTTHTPGPWSVGIEGDGTPGRVYCSNALGSSVALVYGKGQEFTVFPRGEEEANARLIADAPAMKLALDLIAAGVAGIEDGDFVIWLKDPIGGAWEITGTYTDLINKIGWSRAREALAASERRP